MAEKDTAAADEKKAAAKAKAAEKKAAKEADEAEAEEPYDGPVAADPVTGEDTPGVAGDEAHRSHGNDAVDEPVTTTFSGVSEERAAADEAAAAEEGEAPAEPEEE